MNSRYKKGTWKTAGKRETPFDQEKVEGKYKPMVRKKDSGNFRWSYEEGQIWPTNR